ncbi:MAG: hypothetical protein J6I40_02720 [Mailhella sp.]|nr:hypothetical protein [Mailhella sp.]
MRTCIFTLLLAFLLFACLPGCSQERLDDIRISGDMTTGIGVGHGMHGGSRVTTGIDF